MFYKKSFKVKTKSGKVDFQLKHNFVSKIPGLTHFNMKINDQFLRIFLDVRIVFENFEMRIRN